MTRLTNILLTSCAGLIMLSPTAAAAAAASPDGLYLMTRFWSGSGLEMAAYFFHNGAVVLNPIGSTKNLDLQAERAAHPKNVGAYQLQGGQLLMNFEGANHPAKFEPDTKGCFNWDTGIFCPVEVFTPGSSLDGTYEGGASVGGGAVMSSTVITFKKDGTYQRESAASISSQGRNSSVSGGSIGSEHGKYRIDGTALHMMPEGGKESVVSTFPYDDGTKGPAPRRLYYSGGLLKHTK